MPARPTHLTVARADELDPARAALHRAIAGGRRAAFFRSLGVEDADAGLPGPFNAMVRAPAVGTPLHQMGEALRYDGVLPALVRESVILRVAVARGSGFEWTSHLEQARRDGADGPLIEALRAGTPPADPLVALSVRVADALLERETVPDALLDEALGAFGEEGAVELVVLVGYYETLANLMRTFRVE